jgi:uncharacterized membrane protein
MMNMDTEIGTEKEDAEKFFTKRQRRIITYSIAALFLLSTVTLIGWNYYDIMWWISWYKITSEKGVSALLHIYSLCQGPSCKVPYPPLAVIIFVSLYALALTLPAHLRLLVLKMFLVIIPALIIFHIIKKERDLDAALLWLVSMPFLQILFVLQFDVLIACLVLLSTVYLAKKKYDRASVMLALATLIKHVIATLLPLQLIYVYTTAGTKKAIRYLITFMIVVVIAIAPFFVTSVNGILYNLVTFHSTRPPQDLSIWALTTWFLEDQLKPYLGIINKLWVIFMGIVYTLLLYLGYTILKSANKDENNVKGHAKVLSILTSLAFIILIMFSKIGNLNYAVWFVPTSIIALDEHRLRKFYRLTALLILMVSLPYGMYLLLMPAVGGEGTYIPEDMAYWDARALLMQSINYYLLYIFSVTQNYIPALHLYTPSDLMQLLSFLGGLTIVKKTVITILIILAQYFLILLIALHLDALKGG